ncbi:MAG TPA: DUF1571 domain-containing protein [Isosphaeraceae bacterium]|jgi:hypothetical protein
MVATFLRPSSVTPLLRRRWFWLCASVPALVAFACWWFTEPLEDAGAVALAPRPPRAATPAPAAAPPPPVALTWPEETVAGDEAKRRLLEILLACQARLDSVEGYTATFRKQERMRGRLGPEQTLSMKVRHRPFAIYLKFLAPKAGKEVVYAEGRHDNKVIAHNGDWTRRLIPRLAVAPTDPLALADSRHPITDAGLFNLTDRLISFRRMDLDDPDAVTVLDRIVDADGRVRLRSVHTHPRQKPERPFARVEVLYDPETWLPVQMTGYDWPAAPDHSGELDLAERYTYDDVRLDAPLSDLDFDPANPEYAFTRF